MDYKKLAGLLFPDITKTPEDYEAVYPPRKLPEGAVVTRLAPSPTGFIHLGNLYGAMVDERLAHQGGGVCYLRIEDTDEKREVEGAVPVLLDVLGYFGINFDEGACRADEPGCRPSNVEPSAGEKGDYGPYWQSRRSEIYKACVKRLVEQGKAYPCFMSEEEIARIRADQSAAKLDPGIYGKYAKHRDLTYEEVESRIKEGQTFVVRLRSEGDPSRYFKAKDAIRGELSMPENIQDVVILKKNDLPTYHFAHVVDDHLMHTDIVVRGEEWMASLPIHIQLFEAMGWEPPLYCHTTSLMKIDEATGQKRKLSKRKDPELGLSFYKELGYFPEAVREYLLTILCSDYEQWRIANPLASYSEFKFSPDKMSDSGTLFDINKLNDVSKDVLAKKTAAEIYDFMLGWAKEFDQAKYRLLADNKDMLLKVFDIDRGGEKPRKDLVYAQQIFAFIKYFFDETFEYESEWPAEVSAEDRNGFMLGWAEEFDPDKYALLAGNREMLLKVFDIDRGGEKPRKDLVYAQQIFAFIKYFFDETFEYESEWPAEVSAEDRREILSRYIAGYDPADDNSAWFEKVRGITAELGYAVKPKDYKKNPDAYKGHVGHVSGVIRIAITGRANSPDLWTIQQIMGPEMVARRINAAMQA